MKKFLLSASLAIIALASLLALHPFYLAPRATVADVKDMIDTSVFIHTGQKAGSGVVIKSDGVSAKILTAKHVVSATGWADTMVRIGGVEVPVTSMELNPALDIAVITVILPPGLSPRVAPICESDPVLGDKLIGVGFPLATGPIITEGFAGPAFDSRAIQEFSNRYPEFRVLGFVHSVLAAGGSSGGPIFNSSPTGGYCVAGIENLGFTQPAFPGMSPVNFLGAATSADVIRAMVRL